MRRTKNLIALVAILGVLAGLYFFLVSRPKPETPGVENENVTLLKFDKNEIIKIELENEHGELIFNKVEKEIEEEKDGKKEKVKKEMWEVDYPHEILLKQLNIDDIAYTFASLQAERIIEDETPEDLEPYGLKDPQAIAVATLKDGTKKVLRLGDKTPAGNTYYLMMEEDPKVYEVWMNHGDHLRYSLADVRDRSLPQANPMEMTYLMIDKKDGRPIEIKLNDKQSEEQAQFGLGLWHLVQPYREPMGASVDAMQKFFESMPALSIQDFIEDGAQDLSKYGLDKPSAEFIMKDEENTVHLLFGNEYEDGKIYFKPADSDSVYGMDISNTEFMDTKPFNLVDKFAFIVNILDVDKILVEGKGQSHSLTLERETRPSEDEDEEEDEVITTYKANEKEVEESHFKTVYQSIIGILVDGEVSTDIEESPEIRTTFYLTKGKDREITISYVPYDNDFFAVFRGGKAEFAVNKGLVLEMLDKVEALVRGEPVEE